MANADQMAAHLQEEHGNGQCHANPEAPGHVPQFRAFAGLACRHQRLESHAANRTVPRAHLANLRVHRAGVLGGSSRYRPAIMRVMVLMTSTVLPMRRMFPLHRVFLFASSE